MSAGKRIGRPPKLGPTERAAVIDALAHAFHPTPVVQALALQYDVDESTIWRVYRAEGLKVPRGTGKTPTQVNAT